MEVLNRVVSDPASQHPSSHFVAAVRDRLWLSRAGFGRFPTGVRVAFRSRATTHVRLLRKWPKICTVWAVSGIFSDFS